MAKSSSIMAASSPQATDTSLTCLLHQTIHTSQQHEENESSYHPSDVEESTVNDGRNCATKSVSTRQGTTLLIIKKHIPFGYKTDKQNCDKCKCKQIY
eukprot:12129630-Ditylum_brightwellii.AAC.1